MHAVILHLRDALARRRSPETLLRRVQHLECMLAAARQELAGWQDAAQRQSEALSRQRAHIEHQDLIIDALRDALDNRDDDLDELLNGSYE